MPKAKPEEEVTYVAHDEAAFRQILNAVWPTHNFLNIDGITLRRTSAKLVRYINLFPSKLQQGSRDRVKLFTEQKKLVAALDRKIYVGAGKKQANLQRETKKKRLLKLVNDAGPFRGALAKERATLRYDFGWLKNGDFENSKLKISVDKVVAFNLLEPSKLGEPVYYIELEGDGTGSELFVESSAYFAENMAPFVKKIEESTAKWRIASSLCHDPVCIVWDSYEELCALYQQVTGRI